MSIPAINDGGPAFPVATAANGQFTGMSLRDYFAAKAMQGALTQGSERACYGAKSDLELARKCYEMADAMLKAREVTQ